MNAHRGKNALESVQTSGVGVHQRVVEIEYQGGYGWMRRFPARLWLSG